MKQAPNVKLSLRKLLTAMMAVGPLAILPSPVWAILPPAGQVPASAGGTFGIQNGSASISHTGVTGPNTGIATINASDRAVIQWLGTNTNAAAGEFFINTGETYNFQVPAGGAILNRVGVGAGIATISGKIDGNGKVFVLAPGGTILLDSGAIVTASGGLVLSTIAEENGAFLATGDLLYAGTAAGTITIGGAAPANIGGSLKAVAGTINHNSSNVVGDTVLKSLGSGTAMNLATVGTLTTGGTLTVETTNANIVQGAGTIVVGNSTGSQLASFTTNGNNSITLGGANDFQTVSINAGTGGAGAVTINDTNVIRLSNSTIGGSLTVNAGGDSRVNTTIGLVEDAIATVGTLNVVGNAAFNTTGNANDATRTARVNIAHNSTVGGTLSGSISNNASFTFNGTGNLTTGTINAAGVAAGGSRSAITITTTGNLTIAGSMNTLRNDNGNANITITAAAINQTGGLLQAGDGAAASKGGGVTLNATTGNLTVGNIDSHNRVALTAGMGSISQVPGTSIITRRADQTSSATAPNGTVILDNAGNAYHGTTVFQFNTTSANLTNTNSIVLGTTNVTNNVNLVTTGGAITLGSGLGTAGQSITVGGNLSATTAGGAISDGNYSSFNIFGGLNLASAGGNILLDAATANGALAPSVRLGVVNANAGVGTVTVSEATTLNLGNITGSALTATSLTGGIVDSGNFTVTGTAAFGVTGNNSITLDSTNHSIGTLNFGGAGQVSALVNSNVMVSTPAAGFSGNIAVTSSTGRNIAVDTVGINGGLTVNSGGTLDFANAGPTAITGTLTTMSQGATTQTGGGGISVTGVTSVMAANSAAVTLGGANNFSSVVLNNSTGAVTINDVNDLSISGSVTGTGTVLARAGGTGATLAAPWNLTLGNLSVPALDAIAANGGGGNSGTVTQASGTSIHSEGLTKFTTQNNNIVVNNAGNSFGRVEIRVNSTDGNRTVNVAEDGTMRLGVLSSRGTSTLLSRTGSIIEDPDANTTVTNNGTLVASAPAGSILIGGTTTRNGAFTTTGNLVAANLTAPTGAAAVTSTAGDANIRIGTTNVNSLSVVSSNNITQNGVIRVFGTATFRATNNITLDNTGNNFGRVSLTTTNATVGAFKDIVIVENGTLNLGAVSMPAGTTGNFTATSVNGDIIDTGLAGLKPGGVVGTPGTGLVNLSALKGNIILDDPTTDFPTVNGVVFNANNVTLAPLGSSPIYLGAAGQVSTATGNLSVTTALGTGNIMSNGALNVGGDAWFQAAAANITLAQSGNKFGSLKFVGQQVAIVESDDTALVTGSTALNSAQISSGGNITVADRGGVVQFNGPATFLSAVGNLTLAKVQSGGTLSVNAAGTKDLSALSKSADLAGKDPVNLGAGAYVPPGQ